MFQKKIIIVNELKEIHDLGKKAEGIMFKKVYFERFSTAVRIVKNLLSVLRFFETANDTENKQPIFVSSVWVSRPLGLKKARRGGKTKSEPW